MSIFYQIDHQTAPWNTFHYTIKYQDLSLYQIRRCGFRKYRQFEDMNKKILYYIGVTTIKSNDKKTILAKIQIKKNFIETIVGNFILTDMNISQRSYILKLNNNIVAKITRKCHFTYDQFSIEMGNILEEHQRFIFAIVILINSVLNRIQSPIAYSNSLYILNDL